MINPPIGERFKFDREHCCIYDLQTKKSYEVLYDERRGNEDITKICIEILQVMDEIGPIHSNLNNLQKDVKIKKNDVKLISKDAVQLDLKVEEVFLQKLSKIFVKLKEDRPIEIREIKDPKLTDDLNKFFEKSNYDHKKVKELINVVKRIEIHAKAFALGQKIPSEISKLIDYKNRISELRHELDDLSQERMDPEVNMTTEEHAKLAHSLSAELKDLQILLILSLIQYSSKEKSKYSLLNFASTSLPIEKLLNQEDLLNHLSRALKMHAFREEPSTLDLLSVRLFIRQSALTELPLLKEIEEAKLHVFRLKGKLEGSVNNPKTLRLRHELKFTEMFLFSKERKILSKMRQKVIDSIPKNRKLKNEEIATLLEIDLMSAQLTKQINEANEMRKGLKNEHSIAVKQGVLPLATNFLKESALESDFANAMLLLSPQELISSSESWEPAKEAKETSFGASIYNAVKNGLQKAQAFGSTSSALKAIRNDLRKQIDENYRKIKNIQLNHELIDSKKKVDINRIEKEIKILENKVYLINLQRYNNEIVKITDELGFLNYFVQESSKAIDTRNKDLQAEEIKLKLYRLLLESPETEDKRAWLDAKALNISGPDLTILQDISIKLPLNKTEREKVLKQFIIDAEKRKGELHYGIGIAEQEILKADHRKGELDSRFKPIMNKYEADWEGIPTENVFSALADWAKDTFLKSFSFGMITSPAPPHPSQLRMKKEYADVGYNFYSVMEEWKEELDRLDPAVKEVYCNKMMDKFYKWAYTHPATATQLVGDIALTLSVINPNKAFVDHILTPLQAKSFAYTMLQEVGVKDMPATEKDKEFLRFKALADLCRYMPHVTGSLEPLATATQNTLAGAAFAGPFGAFLGIIGGMTNVALSSAKTTLIQDQIDRIQGKDSASLLFIGRIIRKMVQSSPYVDAAVEQDSVKIARDAIIAVNAIKRPDDIGSYLVSKVSYWWKQVKAAPTGAEKLIRLSPAIAVGGTIGLGVLAIAVGGPFTIPIAIGAATLILPFLFLYHRYSPDLDNTFFKNTNVIIKINELEEAIKTKESYFKTWAENYADSLVKKRTLPSKELIPVPENYEEQLKAMKPNDTRIIQEIQNAYTQKLDQKMAELQKVKADQFEANWKAKKKAAGDLSENVDPWREKQKIDDFKNFGKDYCRSPMMRDIVMAFTQIVDMKEVRDAVEKEVDAYIDTIANGKQNFAEVKQTLIENRARQIMSNLIETWLKTELAGGAKEQFRAFYMTYNDEYATQDVDGMLNQLQKAKQKENNEALQNELQNELPFGYDNQQIAEEIGLIRERL